MDYSRENLAYLEEQVHQLEESLEIVNELYYAMDDEEAAEKEYREEIDELEVMISALESDIDMIRCTIC